MGSKTARASGGSKGGGMGPGQSMAMAGNTGLASFSEADINKVQQAKRQFEKATGRDTPSSYAAIGREIGEIGSKYRRPVQINPSLGAFSDDSGRMYTPSDFDARGNMMAFTATPPTLGQMFGDMGRAVTGYNSLQYPAGANVPVMSRTRGLADVLAKIAIPGSIGMNIARDLFSRFFPGQEEEEEGTVNRGFAPEGFTFPADLPQRNIQEETAGPTVDLRTPTIEEMKTTNVLQSGDFGPTIDEYLSAGYGGQRVSPEQQALLEEIQPKFMYPEDYTLPFTDIKIPSLGYAIEDLITGGTGFDATKTVSPEAQPNISEVGDQGIYEVGPNLVGVGPEMGIFNDPFDRSSGYTPGLQTYRDNLIAQGISPEQADQMTRNLAAYGYKEGGLTDTIPPERGPMSEGVASLFKNK